MSKKHSVLLLAAALMILPECPRSAARICQALCAPGRQQGSDRPKCRCNASREERSTARGLISHRAASRVSVCRCAIAGLHRSISACRCAA